MVTIFYGMSGSFKYTTMMSKEYKNSFHVLSDIKPYWNYRQHLFPGEVNGHDGDFIIQRLLTLSLPGYLPKEGDICIERGVSDSIKCLIDHPEENLFKNPDTIWTDESITRIISEESKILKPYGTTQKVLLQMLDRDFVEKVILEEPNRKRYYKDIDTYFEKQKEYVEFTKKFNKIETEILITNANEYLKRIKGDNSLDK